MNRRISVVLPDETLRRIDRLAKPGGRSRFINEAVRHFVATRSAAPLRRQLELAAVRDRDLDIEVAADWFAVDRQTSQE
ncbi:MAG: ribbon-helix-helix domain-containing protein [Bryobacteraceae bacterium]